MTPTLPLAFVAGIAAFFSPCVFPLVPSYLGYVTGLTLDELRTNSAHAARRTAVLHAALFGVGFTIVFVSLGLVAGMLGRVFFEGFRVLRIVGALAIMLLGLQLLGAVRIHWLMRTHARLAGAHRAGKLASVGAGLTFGAAWTPCVGPLLASLLLYAGMRAHPLQGGLLLTAFAAGLGLPFLIVALTFNHYLGSARHARRWLPVIERAAGVVLIVSAVLLLTGSAGGPAAEPEARAAVADSVTTAPSPGGYQRGAAGAAVHVLAFTDFTCGHCGAFALGTQPALDTEFVVTGQVRWTTFVTAEPHDAAGQGAAAAAACVALQDEQRFWRYHELVFEHQRAWRRARDRKELLAGYAARVGADRSRFASCLAAGEYQELVRIAERQAELTAVRIRPTFFINGVRVEGAISYDEFRALLLSALEEASAHE